MVTASHTHPYHGRLLCDDNEQLERTLAALQEAMSSMVPVRIGTGIGYENSLTINRTLRLKSGNHWCIRYSNPCPPDEEVESVGPIDPEIGLVRVDHMDGRPLAVLYNFASHFLIGVPQGGATADAPGFASRLIEQHLGHGCMALFIQGTVGNVIEAQFKDLERPRNSEDNGTKLGLNIINALKGIIPDIVTLNTVSKCVRLPRKTNYAEDIAALEHDREMLLDSLIPSSLNFKAFLPLYLKHIISPDYPSGYSYLYLQAEQVGNSDLFTMDGQNRKEINKYLDNIRALEQLVRIQNNLTTLKKHQILYKASGDSDVSAELQGIRIGDFFLIASPIEVLVEVGQNIKRESPYDKTFIASITNGYLHYGPPSSYYGKGGYEVTECVLDRGWQSIFEDAANEIILQL